MRTLLGTDLGAAIFSGIRLGLFASAGMAMFAFGVAAPALAAATSEGGRTHAAGEFQLAYLHRDRVCCKRGRRDWWTSARQCRRSGGYIVSARACRRGFDDRRGRVCCKRGRRDWWTSARQCRHAGGHIVSSRHCRIERGHGRQVCCYRRTRDGARRYWWMDHWACDRRGGRPVAWRYCRRR